MKIESTADDLIVARSTAPGAAALAVVRLDGRGAGAMVDKIFRAARGAGAVARPRSAVFGRWFAPDSDDPIDEGITIFFAAPASYTGNDLAEFQCHGGAIPSARLIEAALALGARMAEPGEFTRRAFLNGKLDLAQAEAVADLINAQTEQAARLARAQLVGELSARVAAVREDLLNLAAEIEAHIDFPDEDIESEDRERLGGVFERALAAVAALRETRRRGRLLREGARVALAGAPNAGKSSLFNALLRMERSIVTPHPGTTRDTIESTIDLKGIPLTLIDTAGLRQSADPVEQIGVERARLEIERADLVILVHDVTSSGTALGELAEGITGGRVPDLVVYNKIDLAPMQQSKITGETPVPQLKLSCTTGAGLLELEEMLAEMLLGESGQDGGMSLAINLRHDTLLEEAAGALESARAGFLAGYSGELVMVDLREALDRLDSLLGTQAGEEILDRLFGKFCIGK